MDQVAKLKKTWNLAPVLQIVQKIPQNYCPWVYLSIGQVWWLNELWSKRYIQKYTLSHVLILIMTSHIWYITRWLQMQWIFWEQNITFLRKNKILNLCLMWHIFRSYRFVAQLTFNQETFRAFWNFFKQLIGLLQQCYL